MRGFVTYAGRIVASTVLLCTAILLQAQTQGLEYRYEAGVMVGGSCYYGDANYNSFMKGMNMVGGLMGRYNINPRMALKADLAIARITGSTNGNENRFPGGETDFSRMLYELGVQYEYNFWAYGEGGGYKSYKRIVPYIFAGVGCTFAPKPANHVFTANIPLGVGVKYKVIPRLNIGCELSYRFSFSDRLDLGSTQPQLNDPYGIESGFLKNNDSYSFISLFVTYDLSPKYRKCNN